MDNLYYFYSIILYSINNIYIYIIHIIFYHYISIIFPLGWDGFLDKLEDYQPTGDAQAQAQ